LPTISPDGRDLAGQHGPEFAVNPSQTTPDGHARATMDCKYLYIDNIKINFVRRTIEIDDKQLEITPREFDVVEFLLDNMNRIVPRHAIQEAVWGRELGVSSRTLDTHISRIRSKLRLDDGKNLRIIPIYAVGYRLVLFGAAMMHVERHDVTPIVRAASQREMTVEYI
jgi:DNA-binding response OmpR family regulator